MDWPTYWHVKKKMENQASGEREMQRASHDRTLSMALELVAIFERDFKEVPAKKREKEMVLLFIQDLRQILGE